MPAEAVLDYSSQTTPRFGLWRLVRCSVGLLLLQSAIIAFCEWEARNYGRSIQGSWYRNALHATLRIEFAGGRFALAMVLLALVNLMVVSIRLYLDRRSPNFARRLCIAFPVGMIPLVIQFAMIPMYPPILYE